MATKFNEVKTPSVQFVETAAADIDTPVAGNQQLGIDPTTHTPYLKNSAAAALFLMQRLRTAGGGTPSNLQDGDAWIEASGSSPSRSVKLFYRDGGVSVPLQEWVY